MPLRVATWRCLLRPYAPSMPLFAMCLGVAPYRCPLCRYVPRRVCILLSAIPYAYLYTAVRHLPTPLSAHRLSLIHISEPTRPRLI
eukprot:3711089-Rhodomonas_salina.2